MPKTEMITQERLIELFSYNADTGEFLCGEFYNNGRIR